MKKWLTEILTLTMVLALLAGFAVTADAAEKDETKAEAAAETTGEKADEKAEDYEDLVRIGEETEDCVKIKLTNATGSDIMGLNIQSSNDDTWVWSDEMLPEDYEFADGEEALLCYAPGEDEDEQTTYNFQVVFTDWTVGFLHAVDLAALNGEAEIQRAANSLPYLVYTDADGEQISTQDLEQAAFEGELASGFWDLPSSGGSSSSGGGSSSGGSGSSGGGSYSGGANTAGCVGGGALFN